MGTKKRKARKVEEYSQSCFVRKTSRVRTKKARTVRLHSVSESSADLLPAAPPDAVWDRQPAP